MATASLEEYCFLWVNHWSTCMTRAEWAAWAQAIVGLVAIRAALSAVRAAHELAMGAKRTDQAEATSKRIRVEHQRFTIALLKAHVVVGSLIDARKIRGDALDQFLAIARSLLATDYSSFDPQEVIPFLVEGQRHTRTLFQALGRCEEMERRGTCSVSSEELTALSKALILLEGQLNEVESFAAIYEPR